MNEYLVHVTKRNPHTLEELWAEDLSEALDLVLEAVHNEDLEHIQLFKVTYQGEFSYTNPRRPEG